jgi:hypothetical protein
MLFSPVRGVRIKLALAFALSFFVSATVALAQGNGGGGNGGNNNFGNLLFSRVVGGISVDANGVIRGQAVSLDKDAVAELKKLVSDTQGLDRSGQRAVSFNALETAIAEANQNKTALPLEVQFMGGLQRIEFVVATDDDLWLVGSGEGLKTTDDGRIVGSESGMPPINLQDFIVALQTVDAAREGYGISVDIRPTDAGMKQYSQLVKNITIENFNSTSIAQLEQAMGDQPITITGVPTGSHFANVLAAADYRMKRISMGLDPAPITKFPSYMEMLQQKNVQGSSAPRFWMECSYDAIAKSEDGRVWGISGSGVKTLTEESVYDRDGKKIESEKVRKNKLAEKWADMMTERFDELAAADPTFRNLRNAMDLSVVAALIAKEGLIAKANVSAPLLTGDNTAFAVPVSNAPQTVPSQLSFVRTTQGLSIATSGGIQVDSWAVVANQKVDPAIAKVAQNLTNVKTSVWVDLE